MLRIAFAFLFFSTYLSSFGQEGLSLSPKSQYGFSFGINYPNLLYNNNLPGNATINNKVGASLGISGNYRISNLIVLAPKTEISFNRTRIDFKNLDGTNQKYEVAPISLNAMLHARFNVNSAVGSTYFLVGPQVRVPLSNNSNSTTAFGTKSDFAIDLGIGWNKPFNNINFLPELRYSAGLLNINKNPAIKSLKLHTISLIFNFLG